MIPPRFSNPWPHSPHGVSDILRWKLGLAIRETARIPTAPDTPAPFIALHPASIAKPPSTGWQVVWLGHASFLLQGNGLSLLIDPVFSNYCAPFPIPSLHRLIPPPCRLVDLPRMDAVLITHSHYDHLDLPTLRGLGADVPLLVPEGHEKWLRRKGFSNVNEIGWHQSFSLTTGVTATATPALHFTARTPFDRDRAHWCGWRIVSPNGSLWHTGDSGYCAAFREIGERYGATDFGMIPLGAYQPRRIMRSVHMNPDEAVQVFQETRCHKAVGMHWGTFRLTDEPLGEPPLLLEKALLTKDIAPERFQAGVVGKIIHLPQIAAT